MRPALRIGVCSHSAGVSTRHSGGCNAPSVWGSIAGSPRGRLPLGNRSGALGALSINGHAGRCLALDAFSVLFFGGAGRRCAYACPGFAFRRLSVPITRCLNGWARSSVASGPLVWLGRLGFVTSTWLTMAGTRPTVGNVACFAVVISPSGFASWACKGRCDVLSLSLVGHRLSAGVV